VRLRSRTVSFVGNMIDKYHFNNNNEYLKGKITIQNIEKRI
jgi:hypothetical protein